MNYRKKYEQYLGYKLTPDIEVHHLDQNRENNATGNLVALGKDLHTYFHKAEYNHTQYVERGENKYPYSWHFLEAKTIYDSIFREIMLLKKQQDRQAKKYSQKLVNN